MTQFIHLNDDFTVDSILTYRKPAWIQYGIEELFANYDKIITIDDCDTVSEACERLLAGLEDGEFLGQCEPEPDTETVETLYNNVKIWMETNERE